MVRHTPENWTELVGGRLGGRFSVCRKLVKRSDTIADPGVSETVTFPAKGKSQGIVPGVLPSDFL